MSLKHRLTVSLAEVLNNGISRVLMHDMDQLYSQVWKNPSLKGGLALTEFGFQQLSTRLNLEFWSVEIDDNSFTSADIIRLNRYLQIPFYLQLKNSRPIGKKPVIIVFSESIAAQLILYSGNLKQFLEAHDIGNNKTQH
jgi:hypothetical protein